VDLLAEIKGLVEQHKCEMEKLIKKQHQQFLDQQRKLGEGFETLDIRLMLIENSLIVTAGDDSQARHNTHQIRHLLHTLRANHDKCEIEKLIKKQHPQFLDQQRKRGEVFETLDKRLMLIENSLIVTAGDVSQARHNTHQIRNLLQTLSANQELIFVHFGIATE